MSQLKEAHDALASAAKLTAEQSIDIDYATNAFLEARGERAERVCILWARLPGTHYGPQLIAAFPAGEVECMPEQHDERRAEAEEWFRDFLEEGESAEFYTSTALVPAADQGEGDR